MSQQMPIVIEGNNKTTNMSTSKEEHVSVTLYDERQDKNIKTEDDPLSVHSEDMETENKPYREIYVKQERADLMDENDEILCDKRPSEIPFSAMKNENKINLYTVGESETSDFDTRFMCEEDHVTNLDDIKTEEKNQNIKLHSNVSTSSSHSGHSCEILVPSYTNPEQDTECRRFGKGGGLHLKWQNFRDTYVHNNHQSTSRSEIGAKPRKSKRMAYLKQVINPNETEDYLNKSQSNTKDDDKTSGFEENSEPHVEHQSQSTTYRQRKGAPDEKLKNTDAFQQHGKRQNYVYNEDMAFFRSILSTIRTLRQEQKLKFRVDVMNLLLHYFERTPRTEYQQNFRSYHQPLYNTTLIHHPGPVHR